MVVSAASRPWKAVYFFRLLQRWMHKRRGGRVQWIPAWSAFEREVRPGSFQSILRVGCHCCMLTTEKYSKRCINLMRCCLCTDGLFRSVNTRYTHYFIFTIIALKWRCLFTTMVDTWIWNTMQKTDIKEKYIQKLRICSLCTSKTTVPIDQSVICFILIYANIGSWQPPRNVYTQSFIFRFFNIGNCSIRFLVIRPTCLQF